MISAAAGAGLVDAESTLLLTQLQKALRLRRRLVLRRWNLSDRRRKSTTRSGTVRSCGWVLASSACRAIQRPAVDWAFTAALVLLLLLR